MRKTMRIATTTGKSVSRVSNPCERPSQIHALSTSNASPLASSSLSSRRSSASVGWVYSPTVSLLASQLDLVNCGERHDQRRWASTPTLHIPPASSLPVLSNAEGSSRRSSVAVATAFAALVSFPLLITAGCAVGPNYQEPTINVPAAFGESAGAPTTAPSTQPAHAATAMWWTTLNDAELDTLIDRAVLDNRDLKRATSRVREARAQRGIVNSSQLPDLNSSGGFTHQRFSGTGPFALLPEKEFSIYQAGFDSSWELDLFGHVRRGVEAADADTQAAIEDRRDVMLTLLGDVARNYVELRGAQLRVSIAKENLAAQRETLKLIQSRNQAGFVGSLDVSRQAALVATTAASIPSLETTAAANIHALGILLGQDPGALTSELSTTAPIPPRPPAVPAGVPADLLRRRPDIRRAERQLAAATARVGVATADLYPRLVLSGSLSLQGDTIGHLSSFDSRAFSFGPSLTWPIFDAGKIRSNIAVQDERQRQSLLDYQQTVDNALRDVEDAMVSYRNEQTRRGALADSVAASRDAVDLARQQYDKGVSDFLTVLDAQRTLYDAQDALAQSDRNATTDLVSLYKALGGGWDAGASE